MTNERDERNVLTYPTGVPSGLTNRVTLVLSDSTGLTRITEPTALIITLIKFLLITIVVIILVGLLLWMIGLIIPKKRTFRKRIPVHLPVYMTVNMIDQKGLPAYFRGQRHGDEFVQHLDRKGRMTVTWKKTQGDNQVLWHADSRKAACGAFRYMVFEKGIMSEVAYERTLIIRRPMMRVFGLMVSLRREAKALLAGIEGARTT